AVVGALCVTVLLRQYRGWRLMVGGFVLVGLGALGLTGSVWLLGFLGSCLLGFGLGIVNPTANLAAASMWPGRTGSALTLLNLFFSVGAMGAPPVIGYCIQQGWSVWFPAVYGLVTLAGAALAWRVDYVGRPVRDGGVVADAGSQADAEARAGLGEPASPRQAAGLMPFTAASMALLFLYVGVEVSLGGWSTTYMLRTTDAHAMLAASAPSAFWGAILVSRLLSIAILPRVGMLAVLVMGSAIALVGSAWMLAAPGAAMVLLAVGVAGFGLGPVFPNGAGYYLEHGRERAMRLTGVVFASGSVGGAVLPMLIGVASERSGDLHLALGAIPVGAALMLAAVGITAWLRPDRRGERVVVGRNA
nr:MFS transporter [Bryobacterales bacterium]